MSSAEEPRSTRKERRDEAREARKSLEAAESQRQLRRKRLLQLGGAGLAAVVVIGVVFAITSGGKGEEHRVKTGSKQETQQRSAVASEISGIPQNGIVLGNPNAPVTLQYYGDLECPICRDFTLGALPSVIANQVRTGKVKLEYHSMETATREPAVFREQQAAALAAGKQNLMWYFVELFYHEQGEEDSGYVTPAFLKGLATQVPGLNLAKWEAERTNPKLTEEVEQDETKAGEEGFNGTPSFLVGKTGGNTRKLTNFTTADLQEASALFEPTIEKILKS